MRYQEWYTYMLYRLVDAVLSMAHKRTQFLGAEKTKRKDFTLVLGKSGRIQLHTLPSMLGKK